MIALIRHAIVALAIVSALAIVPSMAVAQDPASVCSGVRAGWERAVASGKPDQIATARAAAKRLSAPCPELQQRINRYLAEAKRKAEQERARQLARAQERGGGRRRTTFAGPISEQESASRARRALDQIPESDWGVIEPEALAEKLLSLADAEDFRKLANLGDPRAQVAVGWLYWVGHGGFSRNDAEAVRLVQLAAAQGNASAQAMLGLLYEWGLGGLAEDKAEAVRLYHLAAAQKHAFAQNALGVMFEFGRGGLQVNASEATRLYRLAADQGYAVAKANLARLTTPP